MVCHLIGAKPLREPMLESYELDRKLAGTNFSKILIEIYTF